MIKLDVPEMTGSAAKDVELFMNALIEARKIDVSDNPAIKIQIDGFERRITGTLTSSCIPPRYAKEAALLIEDVKKKLASAENGAEASNLKIQELDEQEWLVMQDYTAAVVAGNADQAADMENHAVNIGVEHKRYLMRRDCSLEAAAQLRQKLEILRTIFNACRMSLFRKQGLEFVSEYEAARETFLAVFRRMVSHMEITRSIADYKSFGGGIVEDLVFRTGHNEQLFGKIKNDIIAAVDGQISAS